MINSALPSTSTTASGWGIPSLPAIRASRMGSTLIGALIVLTVIKIHEVSSKRFIDSSSMTQRNKVLLKGSLFSVLVAGGAFGAAKIGLLPLPQAWVTVCVGFLWYAIKNREALGLVKRAPLITVPLVPSDRKPDASKLGKAYKINLKLMGNPDIHATDAKGLTALHKLTLSHENDQQHLEDALLLLEAGAEVDTRDKEKRTPLLCALVPLMGAAELTQKRYQLIATLLEYRANPNAKDKNGNTPINMLLQILKKQIKNKNPEVLTMLLDSLHLLRDYGAKGTKEEEAGLKEIKTQALKTVKEVEDKKQKELTEQENKKKKETEEQEIDRQAAILVEIQKKLPKKAPLNYKLPSCYKKGLKLLKETSILSRLINVPITLESLEIISKQLQQGANPNEIDKKNRTLTSQFFHYFLTQLYGESSLTTLKNTYACLQLLMKHGGKLTNEEFDALFHLEFPLSLMKQDPFLFESHREIRKALVAKFSPLR